MTKLWIDSQNDRTELDLKAINAGATEHEQRIVISGGLPALPGSDVIMPVLDHGRLANGHALAAPEPAVPQIAANDSVHLSNDSVLPSSLSAPTEAPAVLNESAAANTTNAPRPARPQ